MAMDVALVTTWSSALLSGVILGLSVARVVTGRLVIPSFPKVNWTPGEVRALGLLWGAVSIGMAVYLLAGELGFAHNTMLLGRFGGFGMLLFAIAGGAGQLVVQQHNSGQWPFRRQT